VRKEPRGKEPPPFALLSDVIENTPEEPNWLFEGYVAPGSLTLLAGRPKAGKSTLLFALFRALAAGEPFVGLETRKSGILLLTEERQDTLAEKARMFGLQETGLHVLMRYQSPTVQWVDLVRHAILHCRQHELALLAIDTLDKWTGLKGDSENSSGAVTEALSPLLYAAGSGLAVVASTHQRKGAGEHGEAVRGSNALVGAADIVIELERLPESMDAKHSRVLRSQSRFTTTPEELVVELDEHEGYLARGNTATLKADTEREQIVAVLSVLEEATAEKLHEETELPESTCRKRANQLTKKETLVREGKGGKTDPHRWRLSDSFRTAITLSAERTEVGEPA
jgi:predicted ATP-dependent serine protease